jgi:uncharacterized protein YabE (DUF348 family)
MNNPTIQQISQLPHLRRSSFALGRGLGVLGLLLALWAGYRLTGQPIMLSINGQSYPIRTHRLEVAAIVQAVGLALQSEDRIHPSLNSRLAPGETITLQLARPVSIEVDRHTWHLLTHQQTVAAILAEAGLISNARDQILINGVAGVSPHPTRGDCFEPAGVGSTHRPARCAHHPQ